MAGALSGFALPAALVFSVCCDKETHRTVASEKAAPSAELEKKAAPGALVPGRLDPCVVGRWKGTGVSFQGGQVLATGGANVRLEIRPSGDSAIDFGSMTPISATASPTTFDFSYSGRATAKLGTPSPGTFSVTSPDYSGVRVTAKVSVPAAGSIELFKDTPVSELEKLAKSASAAPDDLPVPEPAAPPPKAIDAAPVFSSTSYTCVGNALRLQGQQATVWEFVRNR